MKFINKHKSPNFNKRKKGTNIKFIIIHYTALESNLEAIKHLCNKKNKVSCHYLISKLGEIYNLVDDNFRAWHAGISLWHNLKDLNSYSIGIELDNTGHHIKFEKFNYEQIKSLNSLLLFLKKKYNIEDKNILGHSDIAPYRKIDPGEKFPWQKLNNPKIPEIIDRISILKIENLLNKRFLSNKKDIALYILSTIGYEIKPAIKNETKFSDLIRAYQMHFNNSYVSGNLDKKTYDLLISHYKELLTI